MTRKRPLTRKSLIDPPAYWTRAYDGFDDGWIEKTVTFECASCKLAIESDPLIRFHDRQAVVLTDGVDPAEIEKRKAKMKKKRLLPTMLINHTCPHCDAVYLILFGAAEWQPQRYVIELGGIFRVEL